MQRFHLSVPHYPSSFLRPAFCPHYLASFSSRRSCHTLNIACRSSFHEFSSKDLSKHVRKSETRFAFYDQDNKEATYAAVNECENDGELGFSQRCLPSKLQVLDPNMLGIEPRPSEWPEWDDIVRASIERRANRVEIPLSLKIVKRKQQRRQSLVGAEGFERCSMKKAFSSMVFIVRKLHTHALLICEDPCPGDLRENLCKRTTREKNPECLRLGSSLSVNLHSYDASHETVNSKEEMHLWNSMLEEASRMRVEFGYTVLDNQTMQQFVSPVTVELEPDNCEEYLRTDLIYQMVLAQEPSNSLLLLNYAQFLHLVTRDLNRAEECFKRAVQTKPSDAEALSQYADFLWQVRKDLWAAEEKYQQAIAAEPSNPSHASKYANFLWRTGGEETCLLQDLTMK